MTENKILKKTDCIILAATLASFVATILIYPNLPARMPYQWGIDGSVKTGEKWIVMITALMPAAVFYLMKLRAKKKTSDFSKWAISLILIAVHWLLILTAKGIGGS